MISLLKRLVGFDDNPSNAGEGDVTPLEARDVFTPNGFPEHTYVERREKEYEQRLRDGLATKNQIISLSGPSKSGKTVLVQRVVGEDSLVQVTGAGVQGPGDFWDRVLDSLGAPTEERSGSAESAEGSRTRHGKGAVGIPGTGAEGGQSKEERRARTRTSGEAYGRRGLAEVVERLSGSGLVILADDFHYMSREAQRECAKQIKDAAQRGVRVITASVPHRSDDMVRANPELRGRVLEIDLDFWEDHNLRRIGEQGFQRLNVELDRTSLDHFVSESAGSPQLMQAICLNACFVLSLRQRRNSPKSFSLESDTRRRIFERTSPATQFGSLVEVLDSGPKPRGTGRNSYKFVDGTSGDVYRAVLRAMAADPPSLSFPYEDLRGRIANDCAGAEPPGSSVQSTCQKMDELARERFPDERVLDWDESTLVLDIADPYLIFYLRWSDHLNGA